jgi:hypothetical protein
LQPLIVQDDEGPQSTSTPRFGLGGSVGGHVTEQGPLPHWTFMPAQEETPVHAISHGPSPQMTTVFWHVEVSEHVRLQPAGPHFTCEPLQADTPPH